MRLPAVLGIAGVLLGAVGFKHIQNAPDLSTPRATVQSLVDAFARDDIGAMAKCVEGGVSADFPQGLVSSAKRLTGAVGKDFAVEMAGDTAKVAVEYQVTPSGSPDEAGAPFLLVDLFTLKNTPAGWLIIPSRPAELGPNLDQNLRVRPLQAIIALLATDPTYRKRARIELCLNNTKQIALASLMYAQDYDARLPRSAAGYKNLLMPYLRSDDVFHCSLDAKGTISYSMNVNLQNRSLAEVANPANTVLLYEGRNGVVDYRHVGRAAIAFVDGHAKLMTETETKSLTWKLPPPAPKKAPTKKRTGSSH